MLQRFPVRTMRFSPFVFFLWLVMVVIAGVLVILASGSGMAR
jgi:hypothetical protein